MRELLMSQLVGLISSTYETNKILLLDGDASWRTQFPEDTATMRLSIKWENKCHCGLTTQQLYFIVFQKTSVYGEKETALRVYHYNGDNCNRHTRFLYELMADQTDIIDDLGIIGHGSELCNINLTNLSAHEYARCTVNANGRTPIYKSGKWTYREEVCQDE